MFGIMRVIGGPDKGRTFTITEGQQLTIGAGADVQAHLTDPDVSSEHCQARMTDGSVRLSVAGRGEEMRVNGIEIYEHALAAGDVIEIGGTKIAFEWSELDDQQTLDPDE